jgi:hypothetical protein
MKWIMTFEEYTIGKPDQARPDPSFQGTMPDYTGYSLEDGGKTPQLVHSFPKKVRKIKKKKRLHHHT